LRDLRGRHVEHEQNYGRFTDCNKGQVKVALHPAEVDQLEAQPIAVRGDLVKLREDLQSSLAAQTRQVFVTRGNLYA
jgi:hypothetical protein